MKPHDTHNHPKGGHGTTGSYIIGFVLSLIFTAIPYYLVVNESVTGNVLLVMVIGFAVVQMAIQILFFLHLGRGPKPLYNVVFFFATVGIILVVVVGSIFIMSNLYRNMSPTEVNIKLAQDESISQVGGEKTGACSETHSNHTVTIVNGIVSPSHTDAHLCDTLTFTNQDSTSREIAFGPHPRHDTYSGVSEFTVKKGHGKTITLNKEGTYLFHDHLEPDIGGDFTVSP